MKRSILIGTAISLALSGCSNGPDASNAPPETVTSVEAAITVNDYARSILILVHSGVYSGLQAELATLVADMQSENWLPVVKEWTGSDPIALKTYLKQSVSSSKGRVAGALFIGDLPTVLADNIDAPEWFPGISDYWYMDLDGDWRDEDENGTYDYHGDGAGDRGPEIFVGRVTASNVSLYDQSELDLLKGYFKRNHRFRKGFDRGTNSSLFVAANDLETEASAQAMVQSQQQMFADTILLAFQHIDGFVVEPGVTERWSVLAPTVRRSDETHTMVLRELANRYNYALVRSHGYSYWFAGLANNEELAEIVRAGRSLPAIINGHACSTARINDMDSMATIATMGSSLAYIGESAVVLGNDTWNIPITENLKTKTLGEAVRAQHEQAYAEDPDSTDVKVQSVLRLLIGDPTLMASYPAATSADPDFINSKNLEVWALGDVWTTNAMPLRVFLKNKGAASLALSGVKLRYYFSASERPGAAVGLQDHYTPSSQPRLVHTGDDQWYVEFDFGSSQSSLAPGASTSGGEGSGEQVQIHWSDWANGWQRYNDYSAEGLSGRWGVTRKVDVFRNGEKIYGWVR